MSHWTSFDVDTAKGPRHVYRTGGDNPPLVLVHGFADSGLCWTTVAQRLEDAFDIIMVDTRGHGLSPLPEEGLVRSELEHDLAQVIEALGVDRPALMGHSMGAATVARYAAEYPERQRGIVLEDPPWREAMGDSAVKERIAAGKAETVAMKALSRDEILAARRAKRPNWPVAECEAWADARINLDVRVYEGVAYPEPDWRATVADIACPALLLHADPELGALVTAEVAQEAASLAPNLTHVHIPHAGHGLRREQLDRFVEVVRPFLLDLYA